MRCEIGVLCCCHLVFHVLLFSGDRKIIIRKGKEWSK